MLFFSIVFSIFTIVFNIFFTNYLLLEIFKNYSTTLIALISLFIVSFTIGIIVSIYSSHKNCKRIPRLNTLFMGIQTALYSIFGWLLIYFFTFIKEPFIYLLGETKLGYSVAQSFMVVLNLITAIIINYYSSIKVACKIPVHEIEKNVEILKKKLNKKTKIEDSKISVK